MENKDDEQPEVAVKNSKKEKKPAHKSVASQIEINPKLEEAKGGTVVLGWGRMNPITIGHEKLVKKLQDVARKQNATPVVYLTHTQNSKKDPLSYNDKIMLAQRAFGNIVQKSTSKTIIQVMQELQKKYSNVVLVVGSDRVSEFNTLLNKYNGKDYSFDSIEVVSAGERDPDADGVEGMSASKMRNLASEGDFETFKKGLPKKLQRNAQDIYDMVRGGMKIAEQMEEIDLNEILSVTQRRKRAVTMRRFKNKIAMARKRFAKKPANKERLMDRARKAAIKKIRAMVAGKKGQDYKSLSPSEKGMIDQRVQKKKAAIDRIAKRLLPVMKRADMARLSSKTKSEQFDLDVAFSEQFDLDLMFEKRYHEVRKKDGTMKFDGRFRAFRTKLADKDAENTAAIEADVHVASTQDMTVDEQVNLFNLVDEICEDIDRENLKIEKKINEKAEQSGTLSDDLFEIYYDAIEEEHDYDMTPQQYGFAAINTYLANLANLKEGVNDPGIFKAVFLAGGPGSGKSFIVGKTALSAFGLKLINSDDAFENALKKVGLKPTPEDIFSPKGQEIRGRAKALTAMKQKLAMDGRLGLTIDGTGKDFAKIQKQAIALKRLGYDIAMIFVNTDLETAQARNAARARTLPADEVEKMWSDVQRNIGKFQNFFGRNMFIVDNSDGANWEGAVASVYKRIGAWTKEPPKNPTALKWIKDAKAQRGIKEELNLDEAFEATFEATDFRKGDTVFQVGSKLKGTVLHKGNRDQVMVKFGSINQMIPASKLRLAEAVESLDKAFDDMIDEAYGDMDRGTPSLTKKYMKDTPYQEVDSDIVKAKDGSYTYKGKK